ncbi:ABC transporter substrate-binding protein, partial [bacterium]|nr:ABC transporter substrate-binding protein [bacterium]
MKLVRVLVLCIISVSLVLSSVSFVFGKEISYPKQYNSPAEYEKVTGKKITRFNEAPMLAELVKQGKLPPVTKRLPSEPLVIEPTEEIGQYGGTVRIIHTNPQNFEDGVNIMGKESILAFDPKDGATILPNLAKSWIFSKDGKTLILELRKGIKWSDGQPFTADDIEFWWKDVILNNDLTPVKPKVWSPGGKLMRLEKLGPYSVRLQFAISYPA